MQAKTLALFGALALVLVAAIVFALSGDDAHPAPPPVVASPPPSAPAPAPRAVVMDVMPRPADVADGAVAPAAAAKTLDGGRENGELDPDVDPEHLRALGLTDADVEPLDGGVVHAATADGAKEALASDVMAMRACLGALQSKARTKLTLTLREIPGRDRAKIASVDVADAGAAELDQERCLLDVVKAARFAVPRGGEARLNFVLPSPGAPSRRP